MCSFQDWLEPNAVKLSMIADTEGMIFHWVMLAGFGTVLFRTEYHMSAEKLRVMACALAGKDERKTKAMMVASADRAVVEKRLTNEWEEHVEASKSKLGKAKTQAQLALL